MYFLLAFLTAVGVVMAEPPGERILDLLSQIRDNAVAHEEVADAHESTRAGICEEKNARLGAAIAATRERYVRAGGAALGPSAAEQQATAASRVNATAVIVANAVEQRRRAQDVRILASQLAAIEAIRDSVRAGFSGDLDAFSTAAVVRQGAHEMYVAHEARYDGYAKTLETVLALMERHFTSTGEEDARAEADEEENGSEVSSSSESAPDSAAAEREWQSEMAEHLFSYVSSLNKGMDTSLAIERALEKEAADAWLEAADERQQLSNEGDKFIEDLEAKAGKLREAIRNLGGHPKGDENVSEAGAAMPDAHVLLAIRQDLDRKVHELELWEASCRQQADIFTHAQDHRSSITARLSKLEGWIRKSLGLARSVTGSSPIMGQEGSLATVGGEEGPLTAGVELPEEVIATRAFAVVKEKSQTDALSLRGEFLRVTPGSYSSRANGDASGRTYEFDLETSEGELLRMRLFQRTPGAEAEMAQARVLASPTLDSSRVPLDLDVAGLAVSVGAAALAEEKESALSGATAGEEAGIVAQSETGETSGASGDTEVTGATGAIAEVEEELQEEEAEAVH